MALSAAKAQQFRTWVSALPNGDRQKFLDTYNGLSDAGKAEAAGRAVGFEDTSPMGAKVAPVAAGLGATAIAGGAAKWMADPFVKKAILQNTQINPLKQKYNINPNIQTGDVSSEIGKQINNATRTNKLSADQFKQGLINEENAVKGGVIKQAAMNVSKNYPAWQNSGYQAYGNGLQNIEDTLSKANVSLDPDKFNQNVIQKTASTLADRGLVQESQNLTNYANSRQGSLIGEDGTTAGSPISFSNAKQAIVNLARQNPAAARELRANWGSHVADISQGTDAGDQMKAINDAYAPFKQADAVAYKFAGANPSVLDTTKVTNALHNYYLGNSKGNPQTTAFLKALGNGTGGTAPIPGLSDQADAIDEAIQKRSGMVATQKLTENNNISNITTLKNDQAQAGTLANIEDGLNSQIKTRVNTGKVIGAGLLGGGAIGIAKGLALGSPYGVVQNDLISRVLGQDPVQALSQIGTAMFGSGQAKDIMNSQIQQAYQKSLQT